MAKFTTFETKMVGPVTLVRPTATDIVGREIIESLSDELLEFVAREKPSKVVLTLKHVSRYSSEAIGGLIRVEKQITAHGGSVKLCMNEDFRELFKVTRLDGSKFAIYHSESDAIAAFFEHGGDVF
jgi:anti-anti-sigma regulatory factor